MNMRCVLSITLAASLACVALPSAAADVAPDKRVEIEALLQTTGALDMGRQYAAAIVAELTNSLRITHPNIPKRVFDVLPEEVNAVISEHMPSLQEVVVQIYDSHFTLAELRELNRFYATPLGQKLVSTLPSVMADSLAAGQRWGAALGPEIARRVQARFEKEGVAL